MKKSEIYIFINHIRAKLNDTEAPLALMEAYESVDKVIREESFYHETPYFLSEWLILKEQVLRNDEDSLGFLDRFLDNILYAGDIGLYEAFIADSAVDQERD